jgi:hypothetical protein
MNYRTIFLVFSIIAFCTACSKKIYESNGETIYKTGKNLLGKVMLNRPASKIKFVNNCKGCHGKNGDAMTRVSIKFNYLSNPANFTIPYNDSLFFRFLDHDLKSDGTKANIGVVWKMTNQDKKDLLEYLKTL